MLIVVALGLAVKTPIQAPLRPSGAEGSMQLSERLCVQVSDWTISIVRMVTRAHFKSLSMVG